MSDNGSDQRLAVPTLDEVEDAARALKGVAVETPLLGRTRGSTRGFTLALAAYNLARMPKHLAQEAPA